jgi:hypothetical protein
MGKYVVIFFIFLAGCTQFAASVSGTFVGNIASEKVLQQMDKKVDK